MARDARNKVYADLTPEQQDRYMAISKRVPVIRYLTVVSNAAWLYTPTTYVICKNDKVVPLPVQKIMVDMVKASGTTFDTIETDAGESPVSVCSAVLIAMSGHCCHITAPQLMVDILDGIVSSEVAEELDFTSQRESYFKALRHMRDAAVGRETTDV